MSDKMQLRNVHGELVGEVSIDLSAADIKSDKAAKMMAIAQDEMSAALENELKKLPSSPTQRQVSEAVDNAYSGANVMPKMITLFTEEIVGEIHAQLTALAVDMAQRVLADGELAQGLGLIGATQRAAVAAQIYKTLQEGK